MKRYTELEDKIILDTIPENGVFTKEVALILKRQLPDRPLHSIQHHWYRILRKQWVENKKKEAEDKAEAAKSLSFWQKFINLFKSK